MHSSSSEDCEIKFQSSFFISAAVEVSILLLGNGTRNKLYLFLYKESLFLYKLYIDMNLLK